MATAGAAPLASDGGAPEPGTDPHACLAGLPDASTGFHPGELRQASSIYRATNRSVELSEGIVLTTMALAEALDADVEVEDVLNFTEERVEVCVFERLASVEREEALLARAVGRSADGDLALGDAQLLVVFRIVTTQNVSLDRDDALAGLALKGSGASVEFEDLLNVERETRVQRVVERAVDLDQEDVLAELVLEPAADPAPLEAACEERTSCDVLP